MDRCLGTKDEEQQLRSNLTTDAATPDKDNLDEIGKISYMLNPNEEVFVVARQSRLKPGGSKFTPNVIFATDRRIIIKDPSMFGLREDIVDIPLELIKVFFHLILYLKLLDSLILAVEAS